jgi:hypothetical protein
VFGEFPVDACVFAGPHMISTSPLLIGDEPFAGMGTLLLPFLTNADAAAIAGGEEGAQIWVRADAHAQAPARRIAIDYAADNQPAPASCGEGMPGCKCSSVGL